MKKRSCQRFFIPGATLFYKKKPGLIKKHIYSANYYPVINISKGGAQFLCDERLNAGKDIMIKLNFPEMDQQPEIFATVRWISKNPEQSYRYQTGIAFNLYGSRKNENSKEILTLLESLEPKEEKNT